MYTAKYKLDGAMNWYKVRLIAKGFVQTYGVDYFEIFSLIVSLNSIRILFSLIVKLDWPMFQLDVKDFFYMVIYSST